MFDIGTADAAEIASLTGGWVVVLSAIYTAIVRIRARKKLT
jgi:hypothetical protein